MRSLISLHSLTASSTLMFESANLPLKVHIRHCQTFSQTIFRGKLSLTTLEPVGEREVTFI